MNWADKVLKGVEKGKMCTCINDQKQQALLFNWDSKTKSAKCIYLTEVLKPKAPNAFIRLRSYYQKHKMLLFSGGN